MVHQCPEGPGNTHARERRQVIRLGRGQYRGAVLGPTYNPGESKSWEKLLSIPCAVSKNSLPALSAFVYSEGALWFDQRSHQVPFLVLSGPPRQGLGASKIWRSKKALQRPLMVHRSRVGLHFNVWKKSQPHWEVEICLPPGTRCWGTFWDRGPSQLYERRSHGLLRNFPKVQLIIFQVGSSAAHVYPMGRFQFSASSDSTSEWCRQDS